jgi:hypothetical protein
VRGIGPGQSGEQALDRQQRPPYSAGRLVPPGSIVSCAARRIGVSDQPSPALRRHVEQAAGGQVGVLVHVSEGTDASALERSGFVVKRVISSVSVVTGTISADAASLQQLIETPGVVEVEPDYEVTTQT